MLFSTAGSYMNVVKNFVVISKLFSKIGLVNWPQRYYQTCVEIGIWDENQTKKPWEEKVSVFIKSKRRNEVCVLICYLKKIPKNKQKKMYTLQKNKRILLFCLSLLAQKGNMVDSVVDLIVQCKIRIYFTKWAPKGIFHEWCSYEWNMNFWCSWGEIYFDHTLN
jgi:hypothetical protein